jgi:SNF2 family DNA or RNA helicase
LLLLLLLLLFLKYLSGLSVNASTCARLPLPLCVRRCRFQPLWLRRVKTEVALKLPPKSEIVVTCPLSPQQRELYRAVLLQNMEVCVYARRLASSIRVRMRSCMWLICGCFPAALGMCASRVWVFFSPPCCCGQVLDAAPGTAGALRTLNSMCMSLRLLCAHPRLMYDDTMSSLLEDEPPVTAGSAGGAAGGSRAVGTAGLSFEDDMESVIAASGKLKVLDRLLGRLKRQGNRVVIFSQFILVLDLLADLAAHRGYQFTRLDGSVSRARRTINMLMFNRASECRWVCVCGGGGAVSAVGARGGWMWLCGWVGAMMA